MFEQSKLFMALSDDHVYSEVYPSESLHDFVSLYFETKNLSDEPQQVTICPDGYFKLIVQVLRGKITAFFLTGLWTNEVDIVIPPKVISYGIKFKVIAPELIFQKSNAINDTTMKKQCCYLPHSNTIT